MGKINEFLIDSGAYSICGAKIAYPESIRTVVDFKKIKGSARITLLLPRKYKNDWLDEFKLTIGVVIDTKSEEENIIGYKLLADLKKEFEDIDVRRSIAPAFDGVLFAVPASKENSFTIVEREYIRLVNILKKYWALKPKWITKFIYQFDRY